MGDDTALWLQSMGQTKIDNWVNGARIDDSSVAREIWNDSVLGAVLGSVEAHFDIDPAVRQTVTISGLTNGCGVRHLRALVVPNACGEAWP
jgi:hypothetical protein